MNFPELVMHVFDNKEYVKNWERLRKVKFHPDNKKVMLLFIKDVENLFWDRLPKEPKPR